MNKRDTIIIAALLNAATLGVLFMMAVNVEDDAIIDSSQIVTEVVAKDSAAIQDASSSWALEDTKIYPTEEVDDLLKEFDALVTENIASIDSIHAKDSISANRKSSQSIEEPKEESSLAFKLPDVPGDENVIANVVDITVKRGDSLDKIAKANGTSISDIKRINKLKTERLAVGQVLKVPVCSAKLQEVELKPKLAADKQVTSLSNEEPVYYTVKSGDNPWKIAKQMRIKMDDLLKLNNLNEEKARNLKIGDKIRIK